MIVVTIRGGLGNQMFQYAFGRAASLLLDRELVLDLSAMPTGRGQYIRSWELHRLPIAPLRQMWGAGVQVSPIRPRRVLGRVSTAARKALTPWRVRELRDDQLLEFSWIPKPFAICDGYWQSHRYFSHISETIRSELTPATDLSPVGRGSLQEIERRESIAVHVRRGDYVSNGTVAAVHGALSSGYHRRAVARIAADLDDPIALVFSDDPQWTIANVQLDIETVHAEAAGSLSATETVALMARCNHHVIANSSLSWWGAYLAETESQQVTYPDRWFLDRPIDPAFRFPGHWRALNVE